MKKILILVSLVFAIGKIQAQEYKTNQSLKSQIINGTVPGAQYSKETPRNTNTIREEKSQGNVSASAIKKNKIQGWNYGSGGSTAVGTSSQGKEKKQTLASESAVAKEPEAKQQKENITPSQDKN